MYLVDELLLVCLRWSVRDAAVIERGFHIATYQVKNWTSMIIELASFCGNWCADAEDKDDTKAKRSTVMIFDPSLWWQKCCALTLKLLLETL